MRRRHNQRKIPNVTATGAQPQSRLFAIIAGLALLCVRGVLLWIIIPLAALAWLPVAVWLRRRGVKFRQFLGWVDLNLIAFLERTVLRPLFRSPIQWTPARAMPEVTHRVDALDLA